jgi:pyruvate ferredoxin oxidoreductase gamma subunit
MREVRFHGRGGQGAVTAATLLAVAAGLDGKYSQAFPSFGTERRGAPVKAFCRIDDRPITIRSQVYNPDYVVVMDSTMLELPDIYSGAKESSLFVINSGKQPELLEKVQTKVYDATGLALEVMGKPIVNTAMVGFFAAATGLVSMKSLKQSLESVFSGKVLELNQKIIEEAEKRSGGKK